MSQASSPSREPEGRNLLDLHGAAAYLNCSERMVRRLRAEHRIRYTYVGRELRFWQTDLDVYLQARAVEAMDEPSRTHLQIHRAG